jgi:hypothetical protein
MRPFGDNALDYKAAGWAPFPILDGGKGTTPGGVTGYDGVDLNGDRLQQFIRKHGHCVIATRAPIGEDFWTIGIDVDHYGDKTGGDTLAAWEKEFGEPLPPTYISTSRDDGVSGIRWFKVPIGWRGKTAFPSVELVQRWHRQGVMPPSLHETRKTPYRWLAQGDLPEMDIPRVADLPWLPEAYLDGLKDEREFSNARVAITNADVLKLLTEGEPCQAVSAALGEYQKRTGSRYDAMVKTQMRLLRLGEQEHRGVKKALDQLHDQYESDRGDERDTASEFDRAMLSGVSKVLANPSEDKGCCPTLLVLTDEFLARWRGERATTTDPATWLGETTTTTSLAGWLGATTRSGS